MKKCIYNIVDFSVKYDILICLLGLYALITRIYNFQNCLIKLAIGYPCPGCGLTRAIICLLELDFVKAFSYNPLIAFLPIIILLLAFKDSSLVKAFYKKNISLIIMLVIILLVYILRLIYVYPKIPMDYYSNNLLAIAKEFFFKLFNN